MYELGWIALGVILGIPIGVVLVRLIIGPFLPTIPGI